MEDHEQFRLANSLETDQCTLDELSRRKSELIRGAEALNPSASDKTLLYLVGDSASHVAEKLMENKHKFEDDNLNVVVCKHTKLRLATVDDANFILTLRTDNKLNKYLSSVDNDLENQKKWLENYKKREKQKSEFYFIITSLDNVQLGTVRLYDFKGDSFCWGSWMVKHDAPISTAIESALSIYEFAFYRLGFKQSHFDVRKRNLKVVKFHKGFGAKEVSSDSDNYFFNIQKNDYEKTKIKYKKYFRDIC